MANTLSGTGATGTLIKIAPGTYPVNADLTLPAEHL
jgi:hypothetical protein